MEAPVDSIYATQFTEERYIDTGGFGVVVHCMNNIDRKRYIVKKISVAASGLGYHRVLREAQVMASMNHPNVIRYHHSWVEAEMSGNTGELFIKSLIESQCLYILMENCDGSLDMILEQKDFVRSWLDDGHTIRVFKDCVAGVAHIHSHSYLHCDLAPPNIFFKIASPVTLIVGDLGLARPMGNETIILVSKAPGRLMYRAPEYESIWLLPNVRRVGLKADIFSLGVILAQLLHPESEPEVFEDLRLQPMPSQWREDSYGPLLARLLSHNPDERPTAAQLLQELS